MNTKILVIGCMAALASSAFARKVTVQDSCVFCTGGISYIEDDPKPIPSKSGTTTCVFCGDSGTGGMTEKTYWSAATTRTVIMADGSYYAGEVTIKTGKYNSKKGTVSVSATFKLKSGKKCSAKSVNVKPDEDWTLNPVWSNVKGLGGVSLAIGIDGSVNGVAGAYEISLEGVDIEDEEVFQHGEHEFILETDDYEIPENYDLIYETIPESVAIVTSNSKSWNCGAAPKIKYQTIKEDGEKWYELTGLDDETKPNVSKLKLKYSAKKNTLSGSFTVYATNEGSIEKGKPKLKSYSFTVKGQLSGAQFVGTAVCKKLKAYWTFVIE